jgi:hypothetical protein
MVQPSTIQVSTQTPKGRLILLRTQIHLHFPAYGSSLLEACPDSNSIAQGTSAESAELSYFN